MTRLLCLFLLLPSVPAFASIKATPETIHLRGKDARQQIVVTESQGDKILDRTREATFATSNAAIVGVTSAGVVTAIGDGTATVTAKVGNQSVSVTVKAENGNAFRPVTFERDIEPILARHGCNAGACHGKARGQNGFALSILGFDPNSD